MPCHTEASGNGLSVVDMSIFLILEARLSHSDTQWLHARREAMASIASRHFDRTEQTLS
jgi:hypothetical protein